MPKNKPDQPLYFQFPFDKAENIKKTFQANQMMKKSDENKPESLREPVAMLYS